MHKYVESKTTPIVMVTVRHITSGAGRTKFQAACFFFFERSVPRASRNVSAVVNNDNKSKQLLL